VRIIDQEPQSSKGSWKFLAAAGGSSNQALVR
jgi:hypothetical protein